MKLNPSLQAASYAANQELPNNLWNAQIHYHVHRSPSLVPIMNQINPAHTIPSYLTKM
jgi:hypothetical protein